MSDEKIYVGQGVKIRARFRDPETSEDVDPGTVEVKFRDPEGTIHDATVTHPALGRYYGRYVVNQAGIWVAVVISTDPGAAVKQHEFTVSSTVIPNP